MGMRSVFYRNLEPSAREHGISAINFAIVLLVLASFLTFSLETEPAISRDLRLTLSGFNILIVSVFAMVFERLLRDSMKRASKMTGSVLGDSTQDF